MWKNCNFYCVNPHFSRGVQRYNILVRACVIVIVFCAIYLIFSVSTVAFADASQDNLEAINKNISELLSKLDLSELDEYISKYQGEELKNYGNNASEIIEYLINGNLSTDYSQYISGLLKTLFCDALSFIPVFAQITVISILSAIVANAEGSLLSNATVKIVKLVCTAVVILLLATVLVGVIEECTECLNNIKSQIEIISPILITLTTLTGGMGTAAIYQPSAIFLTGAAVELVCGFIFPSVTICAILNFLSRLNPDISFLGVSNFIKSIVKWVIGITVAAFSIFLTAQSSSSSLFDGIIFKATKYVVGNTVPIVGGFISGGIDTLASAGTLIKSSVGLCGIVMLLFEVIQPILLLIALSLILKFVGAISQPLSDSGTVSMLSDASSDVEYFIAGLVTVAFMYALVIMLMINSASNFL